MNKKNKPDLFDAALNAQKNLAKSAPLTTTKSEAATKSKLLRAIPTAFFDAHSTLKAEGKTAMDFSAYIVEAVREKLKRDGAL